MPETTLTIETMDDAAAGLRVLRLTGSLTLQSVFPFQAAIREGQFNALVLDFTDVPYMDSAGLGALVGALVAAQRAQRRLALVGANQRIKALMDMAHVSAFFPTFPNLKEAVESLR